MKPKTTSRLSSRTHAVRFYRDSQTLCQIVAGFLADGIVAGEPALAVATKEHRERITAELRTLSLDVPKLQQGHRLLLIDARETLSTFMLHDGRPDAGRFRYCMSEALNRVRIHRAQSVVRCYGEMVDLLWNDGMTEAAIRLEILWNHLANTHQFSLLCGYSMNHFYKEAALTRILQQHTHGVSEAGQLQSLPTCGVGVVS